MSLFNELKRRNVFRVGIAYAIMGWVALQGADFALDLIDAPNWVIQALSIVVVIGLPFALFFAWAFEMTPEGIKREHEVDRESSIVQKTGRKLDRMIIGVLTLAVGYLLVDKLVLQDPATEEPAAEPAAITETAGASVAVLPFVNMSNDADNEYFSDGLTETLLHMLAQLPDLRVAARTSSFAFKGQNKSVGEIAGVLGVDNILEGSVQRAGEQVRVTAQLVRANDGFHIWSQNYTRPLEDIFAIQDEIAGDVASALGASLLGDADGGMHGLETSNLTAYDNYLKGLEQEALYTYGSLEEAETFYEAALAQDANFVDARLALARNYLRKTTTGMISREQANQRVQPLLDQVHEQQPGNIIADAYQNLLRGRFGSNTQDRETARESIHRNRELIALIPTDTFMRESVAGGLHYALEETESAIELLQAGLLIDPMAEGLYTQLGSIYEDADRLDDSEVAYLKAIELAPGNPTAYGRMSEVERKRNKLPAAMDWLRQAAEIDPEDHEIQEILAVDLYSLQMPEEAERWYARVQAMVPGSAIARSLQLFRLVARDESDLAIEASRRMIEDQVDLRNGAFFNAVVTFVDEMMNAGRSQEAYDTLVSIRPEIADYTLLPEDWQGRIMQRWSIPLLAVFAEQETVQGAWNQMVNAYDATGFSLLEDGSSAIAWNEIINGNIDAAVEYQVNVRMAEPVAEALWRHQKFTEAFYAPVIADPRYEAARAAREREFLQVRAEVAQMLTQPEWQN